MESGRVVVNYSLQGYRHETISRPGLSKKWQTPFVLWTGLTPFCQGKMWEKKVVALCLLLIALNSYFNEAPFCLSAPLVCKYFHWSKERYQLTTLFIRVTMLAFHLPNEILQFAVKIAGSQLYLAKESNKSKQCAEKVKIEAQSLMISTTNKTAYNIPYFVIGKSRVFCFLNQSRAYWSLSYYV